MNLRPDGSVSSAKLYINRISVIIYGVVAGFGTLVSACGAMYFSGGITQSGILYSVGLATVTGVLVWLIGRFIEKRSKASFQSHHYFEGLVKRAAEGICVCHETAAFPFVEFSVWNDRMTEITGYTIEEINRLGWYQSLYPDESYRNKAIARMAKMREGEDILSEEWTIQRKDGSKAILSVSTSLSRDESGAGHVLGVMNDLTDVKGAGEASRFLAHDLSSVSGDKLFSMSLDFLLKTLDFDFGFVGQLSDDGQTVNTRVVRNRSGTVDKFDYHLKNTPCHDVMDQNGCLYFNDVQNSFPDDRMLIEMDIKSYFGMPLFREDGSVIGILVLLGFKPVRNPEYTRVITDLFGSRISMEMDRLNSMSELKKAKDEAEQSDRLKSAFLANMSHEIRTPLNGIMGFAQLMQSREASREEQIRYLDIISSNGKHLLKLIGDLIEVALIESGQVSIECQTFSLNKLMEELKLDFKNQLSIKRGDSVRIRLEHDGQDGELLVNGDEHRLRQVLSNLLSNSMKFTSQGEIKFGKRILNSDTLEFWVSDTGIGVEEGERENIFQRFQQGEKTLSRNYDGTGLGLSICKGLVELMGGEIRVESPEGGGSRFVFQIKAELVDDPSKASSGNEKTDVSTPRLLKDQVVLVAEDNDSNFTLLEEILKSREIELIRAHDGWEAIEMVKARLDIDLVFMDVRMPGIDGYEAARRISEFRPNLPIVIQTAFASKEDSKKALDVTGREFLPKPIDPRELIELVEKIVENRS